MRYYSVRVTLVSHVFLFALLTCLVSSFGSEPAQAPAAKKKNARPPTHTVSPGSVIGKVQLDAVLDATEMQPVKIETKTWSDLAVIDAVQHGARVQKGD